MLGNSIFPCPKEYVAYHSPQGQNIGSHGGSLIYIRHDTPHNQFQLHSPLQAVAVQIFLQRKYTVCSLYLPPGQVFPDNDLKSLISQLPEPFLILGDMNGRNPLWGDLVSNQRGNHLCSVIESENLAVLNTGEPTHFHVQTGTLSAIDLSICDESSMIDFNWRVIDDRHTSDHFPIIVDISQSPPDPRMPRWNLEKARWNEFKDLSIIDADVDEFSTIDDAIDLLNVTFYSAGLQSIPRTTGSFRRKPVPWWNKECSQAHRTMRAATTRYRRRRCPYYLIQYRKARAQFRFKIKKARKNSWTIFISKINSKTPLSLVWKKVRKIAGKFTLPKPPVLKVNGIIVAEPQEVANILATHFAKVSSKSDSRPYASHRIQEEQHDIDFSTEKTESYNIPFSLREFESALSKCNDSAPGPDDIPYAMIRHAPERTKLFILSIINTIFRDHLFPRIWELAKFLPFAKPGKDSFLANNYRPIALTCSLCKIMEKMVNARLVWYLEREKYLSPAQCGFRSMRSTTDVLVRMESSICEAFILKQHHVSIFFDLEKAYDTAWRYGILKDLFNCRLRGELPIFIKNFLKNRIFQVQVGSTMSSVKVQEEGVPQGSVLSVTLFALAINGIAKVIPHEFLYTLFVDDLSISFSSSRMAVAERQLQLCINKIDKWADQRGFRFSTSKTVVVHFCRIRGVHPDPDLYLKGQRIPCVDQARFLGLIFDSRMTWVPHISDLKVRCLKALDILKVLAHTTWGADRKQLLRLYKSLVLSKLLYGCEVYTSATQSHLKVLNSIHHAGIRLATGAFKSSPVESMLVDAGEIPLELHYQQVMIRSWCRFMRLPDSLTSTTIKNESYFSLYAIKIKSPHPFAYRVKVIKQQLNMPSNEITPVRCSVTPPWKLPAVEYCKYLSNAKKDLLDIRIRLTFLEHMFQHKDAVPVFTDGSKSHAGVGFGVFFPDFERRGRLPDSASVFTAELHGILKALREIVLIDSRAFIIYCDSLSVLQSLQIFNPTHPLVLDILEWLLIAKRRGKRVSFCWVPAHVDIMGNEAADKLAKSAVTELPPVACPLPCRDLFPSVRASINGVWQQRWNNIGPNKMREITGLVSPWKYLSMPRHWEVALCRLRIGHTRLTHGFLMAGEHPTYCEDCLVPLTVKHLLIECPSRGDIRRQFLSECRDQHGTYLLSRVLGEDIVYKESGIFNFVEEAGLLHQI